MSEGCEIEEEVALDAGPQPERGARFAQIDRATNETQIRARWILDGLGRAKVDTGLGFLDHMLTALAKHGGFDLYLHCRGDLEVDDHHSCEDCALALGEALRRALGDKRGIVRFADAHAPLDEALARVVVDISGRPFAHVELGFARERIGAVATENLSHFFESLAAAAQITLHVDLIRGDNDHHKAEAAFKALAIALRRAVERRIGASEVPSTKGVL